MVPHVSSWLTYSWHSTVMSGCFQEVQGRVSQLKLLFIIVAVVSLHAIFSMYYVCSKYITTYKKCTFLYNSILMLI